MKALFASLLTAVCLTLLACGKNESATNDNAAVSPSAAPKTEVTAAIPAAQPETPAVSADQSAQKPAEQSEVTEQVAEVEEGAEANEEPVKNATPQLKLVQVPSRTVSGSRFKEGTHYFRLSPTQPIEVSPDQVQVIEFFWYGCPHCNALDPRFEKWRTSTESGGKPEYVVFNRIPGALNDTWRFHARFHFAAESLGKLEELHPLIFREIHVNGNPLNTLAKAEEFFAAHGVDSRAFQKHFGALTIERKLDDANTLAQRYRISSVPTFIVNGKFVMDVGSAGGEEQLIALLNELAAREHSKD